MPSTNNFNWQCTCGRYEYSELGAHEHKRTCHHWDTSEYQNGGMYDHRFIEEKPTPSQIKMEEGLKNLEQMEKKLAKELRLWAPESTCPWELKRKGTDTYIWYEVVDCNGWEVCTFGAVMDGPEHDQLLREAAYLVTKINGDNYVKINGELHEVKWNGNFSKPVEFEIPLTLKLSP